MTLEAKDVIPVTNILNSVDFFGFLDFLIFVLIGEIM
jgi:hypothetical protein